MNTGSNDKECDRSLISRVDSEEPLVTLRTFGADALRARSLPVEALDGVRSGSWGGVGGWGGGCGGVSAVRRRERAERSRAHRRGEGGGEGGSRLERAEPEGGEGGGGALICPHAQPRARAGREGECAILVPYLGGRSGVNGGPVLAALASLTLVERGGGVTLTAHSAVRASGEGRARVCAWTNTWQGRAASAFSLPLPVLLEPPSCERGGRDVRGQ